MSVSVDFRTPSAGFDQPIDMWLACHERVLRTVNLLGRLRDHVASHGSDAQASASATSVLRYFDEAAPRHHDDEEFDLFPRVAAAAPPGQRDRVIAAIGALQADHAELDAVWQALRVPLKSIEAGHAAGLDAALVTRFVDGYTQHVSRENDQLAPLFRQCFAAPELEAIGRSMAQRRGVDWEELMARR